MKQKNVFILAGVILLLAIGFFYWRNTHPVARKYRIAKKHVAVQPAKVKAALPVTLPVVQKKFANPKIVIVMDDFGYNKNNLDTLFGIRQPITLSILPDLRYSQEIAFLAASQGYQVILHMPMEASNGGVKEEVDTIRPGMKEEDVIERLKKGISSVPELRGISNHMGSKATEDKTLMTIVFKYLKSKKLYFFDSLTSQKSVCRETAQTVGIPYARRDIFLDNVDDAVSIEKQIIVLRRLAFRKGKAIAVCHDRKNTITVLAKMMPEMVREGVKFVPLSELEK